MSINKACISSLFILWETVLDLMEINVYVRVDITLSGQIKNLDGQFIYGCLNTFVFKWFKRRSQADLINSWPIAYATHHPFARWPRCHSVRITALRSFRFPFLCHPAWVSLVLCGSSSDSAKLEENFLALSIFFLTLFFCKFKWIHFPVRFYMGGLGRRWGSGTKEKAKKAIC